jgi:ABC-type phosphonate transport system ATPase subunit
MVYFPRHQPNLRLLETDWLGPRHGPYRYLGYQYPPNHAVPIAPLMEWLTTHRAFNTLAMKGIHQQQVAKGVLAYTNAGKKDAEALVNAVLNQSVLQENGAVRYLQVGGAAPDTVAMAEKQKRDFSYASGGIVDQFMQQADTLGQERLLRGASNEMLEDMSSSTLSFMRGVCEDIYWFDVRDPNPQPTMLTKQIAGTDIAYQIAWTREHRQFVSEMEFEVDVEPYSYVERSPQARLADLLGALQIVMGMMDQAMAQGITIDVEAVVRTMAKYKNMPELYDCLILNQEPQKLAELLGPRGASGGGGQNPNKPNGQYTRASTSDGAGESMELLRSFGRGANQGELAA